MRGRSPYDQNYKDEYTMSQDDNNSMSYSVFLERLKIEFGDFLRVAESGRVVRHASLKARKQSISLRKILKDYRQIALNNDRRISKIMKEAKLQVKNDL